MVDKRIKYILYILMIISLFFTIKNKVHAADYNVYSGSMTINLCRLYYGNLNNANSYIDGSVNSWGECSFDTGVSGIHEIGIFFNATSYYNYSNRFYTFSGSMENNGTNATIVSSYITRDNNTDITGTCTTDTNSTGQITTFTSTCFVPKGLVSGNYKNLLILRVQDAGTSPTSSFNSTISLKNKFAMFDNYYISNNNYDGSNVANAINNQTQQQHQDSQTINNSIQDANNTIKDSSTDNQNAQNTFDNLNQNMASNSTISDLLLMPIHLLQKILNGLQGSCSAINTGQLFGEDFILPCINIADIIGSTLWGIIDVICSGFLAYHIGKRFVIIFNQFTNLKEGGLESAYD